MQKQFTEQEESLNQQRTTLLENLKVPQGAKFVVSKLNELAEEEAKIIGNKKKFLKNLKKLHTPDEEIVLKKIKPFEKEKNEAILRVE